MKHTIYESFLYQHFRSHMIAGGDPIEYEVINDLEHDTGRDLREAYAREVRCMIAAGLNPRVGA